MIRSILLFTAALVFIFPVGLQAEEAAPKEEAVQKEFNTITSTVTGIDQATHTLTLKNDIGETQEVQVDPNVVKNFNSKFSGNTSTEILAAKGPHYKIVLNIQFSKTEV